MSYEVFTKEGIPVGTLDITEKGPRTVFEFSSDRDPGVSRLVLVTVSGSFSLGIPTRRAGGLRLTKTLTRLAMADISLDGEWRALLVPAGEDLSGLALTPAAIPEPEPEPAATPEPAEMSESEPAEMSESEPAEMSESEPAEMSEPEPVPASPPEPETPREPEPAIRTPEPEPDVTDGWRQEDDPARLFKNDVLAASAGRIRGALTKPDGDGTLVAFPWSPSTPFPMIEAFRLGSAVRIGGSEYIVFRVKNGEPV